MSGIVYSLCALTASVCAWLLLLAWRRSRYRLLLWSSLCFMGLTLNNLLLVLDKIIFPEIDLSLWRLTTALVSLGVLLFGLIWETK
jgi:hypothetical protein